VPVVFVPITEGDGDFPSRFALDAVMEDAPNEARLVMTGFLRRPIKLTCAPENRPTTPSQ